MNPTRKIKVNDDDDDDLRLKTKVRKVKIKRICDTNTSFSVANPTKTEENWGDREYRWLRVK